jgi:hypothetical protein
LDVHFTSPEKAERAYDRFIDLGYEFTQPKNISPGHYKIESNFHYTQREEIILSVNLLITEDSQVSCKSIALD